MKLSTQQKVFVLVVVLINVVVWVIPSDVVEAVARDRQILLGRYSRRHIAWIIGLIPVSAIAFYIHLSANNATKRLKAFRVAAALVAIFVPLVGLEAYLALTKDWGYVLDGLSYRRTPNRVFEGVFKDAPQAYRTYPHAPPGYGEIPWTLTADARGFRNSTSLDQYDVVALGDSFTEGSQVSDEQCWPARLAQYGDLSVCNLGMSGYAPQNSLAALKDYGIALKPKWVVCALYEGNDFSSAKIQTDAPPEWSRFFKRSQVVESVDQFLVRTLGPIGARRDWPGLDILSWLPVRCPAGPEARCYAFPPSFLENHYIDESDFIADKDWRNTAHNLESMLELCRAAGARLVVAYIPTKPRVVLPLVREELPAEKVRAFVALTMDEDLPDADAFVGRLFERLDCKERVTEEWCRGHHVPFISLTAAMRESARLGRQPYFTYNEHWTPIGHAVAAEEVHRRLAAGQEDGATDAAVGDGDLGG